MARFLFKPDDVELQELYEEGNSAEAIAVHYGVSKKTILRHLKRVGVTMRTLQKVTPEIEATIVQMAKDGASTTEAMERFGLHRTTILEYAEKNGIQFKDSYHVGFITTWNGYRMLYRPDHLAADKRGYVREHVLVIEKSIGRYLDEHEIVHHKDGNKTNNVPENLEVTTRSAHASLHARAGEIGFAVVHKKRQKI